MSDAWQERAACKGEDTNLFFPGAGVNPHAALAICRRCPVTAECLEDALEFEKEYRPCGVRGGLTALQRRERRTAQSRTLDCQECGTTFTAPFKAGQVPKYCRRACARVAARKLNRLVQRNRSGGAKIEAGHGNPWWYHKGKCKCEACRAAYRDYDREKMRERRRSA